MLTALPPILAPDAAALILGSMPGEKSLKAGQYYAHPRNAFWPILCETLGEHPADYEGRRAMLIRHQIALWDSVLECERDGSLDSRIRDAQPSDVPALLAACPGIRTILFNGAAARALFRRFHGESAGLTLRALPSTSPANAGTSYARKLDLWREALREAGVTGIR